MVFDNDFSYFNLKHFSLLTDVLFSNVKISLTPLFFCVCVKFMLPNQALF